MSYLQTVNIFTALKAVRLINADLGSHLVNVDNRRLIRERLRQPSATPALIDQNYAILEALIHHVGTGARRKRRCNCNHGDGPRPRHGVPRRPELVAREGPDAVARMIDAGRSIAVCMLTNDKYVVYMPNEEMSRLQVDSMAKALRTRRLSG